MSLAIFSALYIFEFLALQTSLFVLIKYMYTTEIKNYNLITNNNCAF